MPDVLCPVEGENTRVASAANHTKPSGTFRNGPKQDGPGGYAGYNNLVPVTLMSRNYLK